MFTDIHAKHKSTSKVENMDKGDAVEATQGIKRANDKVLDKKKKEKKRALKRLWQYNYDDFYQGYWFLEKYYNI